MIVQDTTTTTVAPAGEPAAEAVGLPADLVQACGDAPSWACETVFDATGSQAVSRATEWLVAKPTAILAIVVLAFVVSRIARWMVRRSLHHMLEPGYAERKRRFKAKAPAVLVRPAETESLRTQARAQTITAVLQSIASIVVWLVAVVWVLDVLGVNLGPIIAGAGIAGVALGFGAQNVVRDFLAGFFMVVEDQLGVGDVVDLEPDVQGTVERVTLRSTRVRGVDGTVWHVPNGQILRVGNMSQDWARALLDVEVAYGTDLDRAKEVMMATVLALGEEDLWRHELLGPPEVWGVELLGASGITVRLVVKTRPGSQWKVMRELRGRIAKDLASARIDIPYPHLTIKSEPVEREREREPGTDAVGGQPDAPV